MRIVCIYLFLALFFPPSELASLSVGSNTVGSRQANIFFPQADTNNRIIGFAALEKGFTLQSQTTTCTYDNFWPVSGVVGLQGGSLYLLQDLILSSPVELALGGKIYGNNNSIEFSKQFPNVTLPSGNASYFWLNQLTTAGMSSLLRQIDWSFDDKYIAASTTQAAGGTELRVFYFDGSTLTQTQSLEIGVDVYAAAWNPVSNYLAYGTASVSGDDLVIRRLNTSNGTFSKTDGRSLSADVLNLAWHQSGKFIVSAIANTSAEIRTYSFDLTTGLLTDIPGGTINLSPSRNVSRYGFSWAPGGNYLAVGTFNSTTAGSTELLVCSFNTTSLTITTSAEIGNDVAAVDWSPTGSYIAAVSDGQNIRIYRHELSPQRLIPVNQAWVTETNSVDSVHWDSTGSYLLVGIENGASSRLNLYYFDKLTETLNFVANATSATDIETVRWSHSGLYAALGNANQVIVFGQQIFPYLLFKDTTLVFNTNVDVVAPIMFQGSCVIRGRGNVLNLLNSGQIIIRPNSNLVIEDAELQGISTNNFRCMSDSGVITLRNGILTSSNNYTFSRGAMIFDKNVLVTGTNSFVYTSGMTSTVNSQAMLFLDRNISFTYAPRLPLRSLIQLNDASSVLYLNGCSVFSTRTGLQLDAGTLVVDDTVTLSSSARFDAEALRISSNVNTILLGGATLNVFGRVRYD